LTVTVKVGENPASTQVEVTQVDEDVFSVKIGGKEATKVELQWPVGHTSLTAVFSKSGMKVVSQVNLLSPSLPFLSLSPFYLI
jgi:hypothetical protein